MNMHLFLEHLYKKKINNLMISNFNQIYFRILMISGWIVKKKIIWIVKRYFLDIRCIPKKRILKLEISFGQLLYF